MVEVIKEDSFAKSDIRLLMNDKNIKITELCNPTGNRLAREKEYKNYYNKHIKGKDDTVFLTRAYILEEEFPRDKWCLDYERQYENNKDKNVINDAEILARESDMLKRAGFVDINELSGFEYSRLFVYPNAAGKEVIDKVYGDDERKKLFAMIETTTKNDIQKIIMDFDNDIIDIKEPRDEQGEPDYYGEFELSLPKGYKKTGLEMPVLMWMNDYCDFETLLEECKEYENDIKADYNKFLERNRIVSGLSIGTLVIEGGKRSGTSVTARLTKEQNKLVFCIPSSLENPKGITPNNLIKQGNILVTQVEDIIQKYPELNLKIIKNTKKKIEEVIEKEYKEVYKIIPEEGTIHINEILKKLNLGIQEINYKLMMLELEDKIVSLPGQNYKRK